MFCGSFYNALSGRYARRGGDRAVWSGRFPIRLAIRSLSRSTRLAILPVRSRALLCDGRSRRVAGVGAGPESRLSSTTVRRCRSDAGQAFGGVPVGGGDLGDAGALCFLTMVLGGCIGLCAVLADLGATKASLDARESRAPAGLGRFRRRRGDGRGAVAVLGVRGLGADGGLDAPRPARVARPVPASAVRQAEAQNNGEFPATARGDRRPGAGGLTTRRRRTGLCASRFATAGSTRCAFSNAW